MEKVSNEMFVLRIDFAAFYQQQHRSAMRQFKKASAAAAAVSRHPDGLQCGLHSAYRHQRAAAISTHVPIDCMAWQCAMLGPVPGHLVL
jgi:hypothetical protein